jgi:membrane-bound inhibitor of C-type lysozyme
MDWRCDGGAAFSARVSTSGTAEVFAGGQTYSLPHVQATSGAKYSNGSVEYWERGGEATLGGARGGPYNNCRRG